MKKIIYLLLAVVICSTALAQEKKKDEVKRKAKEKSEKRLDDKIDKTIDGGLDKIEGLFKRKKKKKKGANSEVNDSTETVDISELIGLGTGGQEIAIKPSYQFNSSMKSQFKFYDLKKNKEVGTIFYEYFFSQNDYIGMKFMDEEGDLGEAFNLMIIDGDQSINFMENEGSKMATGFNMNEAISMDEATEEDWMSSAQLKQTGKTKQVAGYECNEYVMEDESANRKMTFWVAPTLSQLANQMGNMYKGMQGKGATMSGNPFARAEGGMVLEMHMIDKKENMAMTMTTHEVNPALSYTFNTEGYQVFNMSQYAPNGN